MATDVSPTSSVTGFGGVCSTSAKGSQGVALTVTDVCENGTVTVYTLVSPEKGGPSAPAELISSDRHASATGEAASPPAPPSGGPPGGPPSPRSPPSPPSPPPPDAPASLEFRPCPPEPPPIGGGSPAAPAFVVASPACPPTVIFSPDGLSLSSVQPMLAPQNVTAQPSDTTARDFNFRILPKDPEDIEISSRWLLWWPSARAAGMRGAQHSCTPHADRLTIPMTFSQRRRLQAMCQRGLDRGRAAAWCVRGLSTA